MISELVSGSIPINDISPKQLTLACVTPIQWCSALPPIQCLEGCHLQTSLVTVVVRELSIRQTLIPTTTILKGTNSQHIIQNLICPLRLSIGLWVISGAKVQLCIHGLMKLLTPKFGKEYDMWVRFGKKSVW
jgi:hypothetical protein